MKTKLLSSLLLLTLISFSSFAWKKVIIRGGGKDQKFNYVEVTEKKILCEGVGHIVCPVTWYSVAVAKTTFPLDGVVSHVQGLVGKGEYKGEDVYEGELKIEWYKSDENLEITIYDDDSVEFKPYEEKE